ncbi:hypothetical protein LCGC14_2810970 [marine sediment metagenome]|uniref:Uncharacterized protein n=1 Tax=marine sediment metagenome TaxID=412755 RepID=A0A0F8YJV0_9ZZZZ
MSVDDKGRVCLDPGESAVLHITGWKVERKRIAPRNRPGFVFMNVLTLQLDEVDGEDLEAEYLVTSERLAVAIMPLLESGAFRARTVVLSAEGTGRARRVTFQTFARGAPV